MSRPANKLPVFSSSGPDIVLELSEEQFDHLTAKLGVSIFSEGAKADLLKACRAYLTHRAAELSAAPQSDALDSWFGKPKRDGGRDSNGVRETLVRMIALGEGAFPVQASSSVSERDVWSVVDDALFDGLMQAGEISLTKADIEPSSLDPMHSAGHQTNSGLHLKLSRDFMLRFSGLLRRAVECADAEMNGMGSGFRLGGAFDDWCRDMRAWAKGNGFPYGYSAHPGDDGASKFSQFLHALYAKLPPDLRDGDIKSAGAMAARLRRIPPTGEQIPRADAK